MKPGEIEINGTGDQSVSFRPVRENWSSLELEKVVLEKLKNSHPKLSSARCFGSRSLSQPKAGLATPSLQARFS